jgi:hypothetical protein
MFAVSLDLLWQHLVLVAHPRLLLLPLRLLLLLPLLLLLLLHLLLLRPQRKLIKATKEEGHPLSC